MNKLRRSRALIVAIGLVGSAASLQARGPIINSENGLNFRSGLQLNLEATGGSRFIGDWRDGGGNLAGLDQPKDSQGMPDDFSDYLASMSLTGVDEATFDKEWAFGFGNVGSIAASIPEPSASALLGLGLAGALAHRRPRRSAPLPPHPRRAKATFGYVHSVEATAEFQH